MNISNKEIVLKIKERLVANPERWIQGAECYDKNNQILPEVVDTQLWCGCLVNHISNIQALLEKQNILYYGGIFNSFKDILGINSLVDWNDAPERTVADIINLCDTYLRQQE